MNQFSFTIFVGLLLVLLGINGASSLSTSAVVSGYDGSVLNNAYSFERLSLLGLVGTHLTSELIDRGQDTVILRDDKRPLKQQGGDGPDSVQVRSR